jgi:beta-xylosidase
MVGVDGKGVITYRKPVVGGVHRMTTLPASDGFDQPGLPRSAALGMQWGWNHNPDSTKWSLTERPGYLRLRTVRVVPTLREARNTLTQRMFAYYSRAVLTTAVTRMEVDSMKDGDIAGLAVFQDPYAYVAVRQGSGSRHIVMVNDGKAIDSVAVSTSPIYLRALASYGSSTGNKFCLFNYATKATGGFVDFDWFTAEPVAQSK